MKNPLPISQTTLASSASFSGVGLHSGKEANVKIHPAASNTGIVFCLKHSLKGSRLKGSHKGEAFIPAHWQNVVETNLRTVIRNEDGFEVATIEHLMAAFAGMGIDNAIVEIDQNEVPIMDGSALHFCNLINNCGVLMQDEPAQTLELKDGNVRYQSKERKMSMRASEHLTIWCSINYDDPHVGSQSFVYHHESPSRFLQSIAPARTFCFKKDIEQIRCLGLGKGGSMDSAIVMGENGVENPGGLRFPNEHARHKVLDCIGDLALCGKRIVGEIRVSRGGHLVHINFLRKMLSEASLAVAV